MWLSVKTLVLVIVDVIIEADLELRCVLATPSTTLLQLH